ncbi:MAG: RHS repeat-associated core domain-containing protein [Solirubrobacterales bacterium]
MAGPLAYDQIGRVTSTTDALGMATSYGYDAIGNATSSTDPSGETTYEYDDQQRVVKLTTPSGREHRFTYDGAGRITTSSIYKPSGEGLKLVAKTSRFYDRDGRLTSSYTRNAAGTTVSTLAYEYDENGNPLRRSTGNSDQRYAYDAVNRLTQVAYANHVDTYTYDQVGNRTSKNGEPYTYSQRDEMLTAPGGRSYSYDPQGRRISEASPSGTETYAWDSLDRLTSRSTAGGALHNYAYDGQGRLTRDTAGGFSRTYDYALSDSPVRIGSSLTTGTSALDRVEKLTYGPLGLAQVQVNDQAPTYPLADAAGTLIGEVTEGGAADLAAELDPWGVPTGQASSTQSIIDDKTIGFLGGAGREEVADSGITKLGARYYDAETGSFISVDPVVGDPSEPVRRVPYIYAASNPAAFTDVDGRSAKSFAKGAWDAITWPIVTPARAGRNWGAETSRNPQLNPVTRGLGWAVGLLSSLAVCENLADSLMAAAPIPGPGKFKGLGKAVEVAEDAVRTERRVAALPALDRTGKLHGELPTSIPTSWTREQLRDLAADLRASIRVRRDELARRGEDGPHRRRLQQEEQLLKQVNRRLGGK